MRRLAYTIALSAATLAASPVWAEDGHGGHGEHEFYLVDMAPVFVNFFLLLIVFNWLFRDKVASFLRQRKAEVTKAMEEAAEIKAAAEAKQAEYTARLETLDADLERMKREMHSAAEAERDRIVKEAETRATRMREETEFLVAQQTKQLRIELTREAVDAAIEAAEQVLTKAVNPQDHQRLADDYLAQLKQQGAPNVSARPARIAQESRA